MYAYTIQNNIFLIVQGVAKDVAPSQGHVHGSFKGIVYIFAADHIYFVKLYFIRFLLMFLSIDNVPYIYSFKNHNIKK